MSIKKYCESIFFGRKLRNDLSAISARAWKNEMMLRNMKHLTFKDELSKFQDIHKGERCVIVGNGPSLNKIDMSLVKNEITLGSNRVYLGFEKWGFEFKYWMVNDETQIKQSAGEYVSELSDSITKFVPLNHIEYFDLRRFRNYCPVNVDYRPDPYPQFSSNPDSIYEGWTVTFSLMQIAVIMGCNPIYLIGVDHSYKIDDRHKKGNRWSDDKSESHFISDYCNAAQGQVWNLPDFEKTDAAYACAAQWGAENNCEIFNATPGTKLDVFPKVKYEDIFSSSI